MIICVCKCISDSDIESAVGAGSTTYESLQCSLGVGTQCGSCSCEVKEILQNVQTKKTAFMASDQHGKLPDYGVIELDKSVHQTNNI